MSKNIYKEIAKKYGVSVMEVKKEMQAAINAAYISPTSEAENVPRNNEIPIIEEFIDYAVGKIRED